MTKLRRPRYLFVCRETFYRERLTARLTRTETAAFLGVTVRTIRNWENGDARIPYPAFKLIRMRAGGIVHVPGWNGWRFSTEGVLYSPDGRSFEASELYNIRHIFSMARCFREMRAAEHARVRTSQTPHLVVVGGAA